MQQDHQDQQSGSPPLQQAGFIGKTLRFNEVTKFLPVSFVVLLIAIIYSIFCFVHCKPMLQDEDKRTQTYVHLAVFHFLTMLMVICYVRSIRTSPGEIPDDEEWAFQPRDLKSPTSSSEIKERLPRDDRVGPIDTKELKRSGDRRHCKWCRKYKPDRCHHCRACRICVLKMDHHCPWIYNCVGFRNHKYFFLLIFYSAAVCNLVVWSMLESVRGCLAVETSFLKMFLLLFGFTLSGFLAVLVTVFFGFHIWLAGKGMTTIEFCEKALKTGNYNGSPYDEGLWENAKGILGPNMFLWLLPLSPPAGDGITFVSENSRLTLTHDAEVGRGYVRRRSHRPARRDRGGSGQETPQETPRPEPQEWVRHQGAKPLKLSSVAGP